MGEASSSRRPESSGHMSPQEHAAQIFEAHSFPWFSHVDPHCERNRVHFIVQRARPQFRSIISPRLRFAAPHVCSGVRYSVPRHAVRLQALHSLQCQCSFQQHAHETVRTHGSVLFLVFNLICALLSIKSWARCLLLNVTFAQVCIRCRGLILSRQGEFKVRRPRN